MRSFRLHPKPKPLPPLPPNTRIIVTDDEEDSDDGPEEDFCLPQQFWPTLSFLGVSMSWAILYAYLTPTVLSFDIDLNAVGLIWFLASFASLLVCPLVGAASDYTRHAWGRRRVFIVAFLVVACGGFVLLAYAEKLGTYLGDDASEQYNALALAIAGLLMAEVGIDLVQSMERALLTDVLEADQLQGANAMFSLNGSLGRVLGYALGSCTLSRAPLLGLMGSQTQILFTLSAAVLFVTTALTVFMTPEKPFIPQLHDLFNAGLISSAKRASMGTRTLPKAVRRAFVANLMNWSGWCILFFFGSDWMAAYIFGGDEQDTDVPHSPYEKGIQAASFGYLLMALVGAATSLGLAALTRRAGFRRVWVLSLLLSAGCFLGLFFVPPGGKAAATVLFATLGVPLAASYQLPWTCVTVAVRRSENGALYCSIFRMSEVLPIAVMGLFTSLLLTLVKGSEHWAFVAAAVLSLGSAAYTQTRVLDLDEVNEYEEND